MIPEQCRVLEKRFTRWGLGYLSCSKVMRLTYKENKVFLNPTAMGAERLDISGPGKRLCFSFGRYDRVPSS